MTKTSLLAVSTLLLSGAAQAATFSCSSLLEGYNFAFTGSITGNKVVGKPAINVTEGGKLVRHAQFVVASSQFTPGQALQIEANGESNSKIIVNAAFANGAYAGPMAINSDEGNINLAATCSVK